MLLDEISDIAKFPTHRQDIATDLLELSIQGVKPIFKFIHSEIVLILRVFEPKGQESNIRAKDTAPYFIFL